MKLLITATLTLVACKASPPLAPGAASRDAEPAPSERAPVAEPAQPEQAGVTVACDSGEWEVFRTTPDAWLAVEEPPVYREGCVGPALMVNLLDAGPDVIGCFLDGGPANGRAAVRVRIDGDGRATTQLLSEEEGHDASAFLRCLDGALTAAGYAFDDFAPTLPAVLELELKTGG